MNNNLIEKSEHYLHILANIWLVLDNVRPAFLLEKYDPELLAEITTKFVELNSHEIIHRSKGKIGVLLYITRHELIGGINYTDKEIATILGYPEPMDECDSINETRYLYSFDIHDEQGYRDQIFGFNTSKKLYSKKYQELCEKISLSLSKNLPAHYSLKTKILKRNTLDFHIKNISENIDMSEDEIYDLALFLANHENLCYFEMLQHNVFIFGNVQIPNAYCVNKFLKQEPYKFMILSALFNHHANKYELIKKYWYDTIHKDSTEIQS